MNKFLSLITLSMILSSCMGIQQNKPQLTYYPTNTNDELKVIISKFEQIYKTKVNYPVNFVSSEEINKNNPNRPQTTIIGQCQRISDNSARQVIVNQDYWNHPNTSPIMKEMTVFHELGHCHFLRDHDNAMLDEGTFKVRPKSIMTTMNTPFLNPIYVNGQFVNIYTYYYGEYLKELSSSADVSSVTPAKKMETTETPTIIIDSMDDSGSCADSTVDESHEGHTH